MAAILLLLVFLFNLAGYRVMIYFLQEHSAQKLEAMIDGDDYREEELIEMRVPMNMPYQQRFTAFERHYGRISIEGREYTYVKRKVEGDILILKCLPNHNGTRLQQIKDEIAGANSNTHSPGESPAKSQIKIFSIECDHPEQSLNRSAQEIFSIAYYSYISALPEPVAAGLDKPPQLMIG
ncbi:MAG: hypothetical protein IPG86_10055 [Chitinophagaceae bacterium]|nr:hypothetical protein [Chitinophagaceae bacterium]